MSRPKITSMWSPLSSPTYLLLFIATIVSNIGTWMHEVGAAWLMTLLTRDPAIVALVQMAVSLPIFLFALPAGALADVVDRRKMLLVVNVIACGLAAILACLIQMDVISPSLLLVFTFLLGSCAAFMAPAWQAIVPSLVNRAQLSAAVSLNGVGINISRAIGPSVAGVLIVSVGIHAPFTVNALSFLAIIGALLWWKPPNQSHVQSATALPKEHLIAAMINGLRYARHSEPLQATLIRAFAFFIAVSAFWSLLPVVVSQQMQAQAELFGIATGFVGVGALCGAVILPALKAKYSPSRILQAVSLLDAFLLALLALTFNTASLLCTCFMFGAAWILALANLNVSAQTALPNWVRARGLSVFLMVFFGAMSVGSIIWGNVATLTSLSHALLTASGVLVIGVFVTRNFPLNLGSERDLEPTIPWSTPQLSALLQSDDETQINEVAHADRGPVMVTIEYQIKLAEQSAFLHSITQLGEARKRYGAYQWGVMQNTNDPRLFTEYFFEQSWLQHLHHHARVAGDDRECQALVNQFHQGENAPVVTHMLSPVQASSG